MKNGLELGILKSILKMKQNRLQVFVTKTLNRYYDSVISEEYYVYAEGNIPIALVAHLDTIHPVPVIDIYHDKENDVLWSPQGLGADDRAGVYAILSIINDGFRPHIIFTRDEELGGIGAFKLASKKCPFKELKYIIELDRKGTNDCVFYDLDNPKFVKYIEKFGFKQSWGSFSDISYLAPEWQVCAVNLSIGYFDEHSQAERLYLSKMADTIKKVEIMLSEDEIPKFEYIDRRARVSRDWCDKCQKPFAEFELFPVINGTKKELYCSDCVIDGVEWCTQCGTLFKATYKKKTMCPRCEGKSI